MTLSLKHTFVSPKADGGDSTMVRPSNWNAEHNLVTDKTTGIVAGRIVGSVGPLVDLPLGLSVTGRMQVLGAEGLTPPTGTTGSRPTTPRSGEIRYNTTISAIEIWLGSTWVPINASSFMPTGTVTAFAHVNAPTGWLRCDGQLVSTTAYANLFALLAYGFGGSGSSFGIPDLRGRVVAHQNGGTGRLTILSGGGGSSLNDQGGAQQHTLTLPEIPSHAHTLPGSNSASGADAAYPLQSNMVQQNLATQSVGGSGPHNNLQPTIVLNWIIKT